jgi:sulfide:quinone oxidoreductase
VDAGRRGSGPARELGPPGGGGHAGGRDRAVEIDPDAKTVATAGSGAVGYDFLIVCPGLALDWDRLPGSAETLGHAGVSSNYSVELAPRTWEFIRPLRRGTAVFTMPSGPIKCAGAPQKIAYLAADWWRKQGTLKDIRVVLVLPTPAMFGVPEFSKVLEGVAARYGIEVLLQHEVTEINPDNKEVVVTDRSGGGGHKFNLEYDVAHLVPPQSAPGWIKAGPLAAPDNPGGYVDIDKETLRHRRYPDVFSLGDAGSSPNSKTGAAIRKQAPVVVENLRAVMAGREPTARYDGYASCPLTTARNKMLLAEFDYTMKPHPTFPVIDTQKERYDMWLLKRYGLPFMYWHLMLKGLA